MLALFGQSSGSVPPFDPAILNAKGSLFLTRPSLAHYLLTRDELLWRAGDLFNALQSGALTFNLHRTFTLEQVPEAHRLLEGRATTGKLVITIAV
jgi:NADPH:quinone reductase